MIDADLNDVSQAARRNLAPRHQAIHQIQVGVEDVAVFERQQKVPLFLIGHPVGHLLGHLARFHQPDARVEVFRGKDVGGRVMHRLHGGNLDLVHAQAGRGLILRRGVHQVENEGAENHKKCQK